MSRERRESRGPLPAWCGPIAKAASVAYGLGARWNSARLGRQGGVRVGRPVISVGNIVAGGTGKSPFVRWVCARCLEAGVRPLIAMRGYRGRHGTSDEAAEHGARAPGVSVAAHPDRSEAIARALRKDPGIGAVVLDDGFQHRRVARDLDIVLIDATRPCMDDRLLPYGWQRERTSALARADAVVVTHAPRMDPALADRIRQAHGRDPVAWCDHAWTAIEVHGQRDGAMSAAAGEPPVAQPLEWLRNRAVAVWAGIARPELVVSQATALGAQVADAPALRDHAHYPAREVRRLSAQAAESGASAILMTGKDWVKVAPMRSLIPMPVAVVRLELRFVEGEGALADLVRRAIAAAGGSATPDPVPSRP